MTKFWDDRLIYKIKTTYEYKLNISKINIQEFDGFFSRVTIGIQSILRYLPPEFPRPAPVRFIRGLAEL